MTPNQKSYFDNYPDVQELHFCSDGMPFFVLADAQAHSNGLADTNVTTINRNEAVGEQTGPVDLTDDLDLVVTEEELADNPALAAAGIHAGEEIELHEDAVPVPPGMLIEEPQSQSQNQSQRRKQANYPAAPGP